jgi:hypothetical protein
MNTGAYGEVVVKMIISHLAIHEKEVTIEKNGLPVSWPGIPGRGNGI